MNLFLAILRIAALLFLYISSLKAQKPPSLGFSGAYNIPLETIAIGIRANIPLHSSIAISPQLRYTPGFNDIHEFSAGANLHYHFIRNLRGGAWVRRAAATGSASLYLIGGVHYNRWINYSVSLNERAKKNNILPEIGIGAMWGKNTVKIFLEGKYNPLWMEPSAEAGLLVFLFDRSRKLKCFY